MKRILLGITFVLIAVTGFAEEQSKFPFIGKVNQDNVNIRAGCNQNFEILAKVNSKDMIFVVEESYGWYKIRLPKSAHVYVAKDFIEKKSDGESVSKVSSLNLRARPAGESSIISQINKGDPVTVVTEDADGWYEILPSLNSYGWIKSDFVSYYSSDVIIKKPSPVAQGEIQNMGFTFRRRPGSHKLVLDNKSIYYLKSSKYNLKLYEGEMVSVWGDMQDLGTDRLVIDVTGIEPMKNDKAS